MSYEMKMWLIALVMLGAFILVTFFPLAKKHPRDEKEQFEMRTLSCKNVALNDAIKQQMGVFYYQLGEWLKTNRHDQMIFQSHMRLCAQMKIWGHTHRKALNSVYPDLPHTLRQVMMRDLRTFDGDHIDPFSDLSQNLDDVYQNPKRLQFIACMQTKYNVHPDARI